MSCTIQSETNTFSKQTMTAGNSNILWNCTANNHRFKHRCIFQYVMPSVRWHWGCVSRKGIQPVKNWVVGSWHGYVSGSRCRFSYGPAAATAIYYLLAPVNPHW